MYSTRPQNRAPRLLRVKLELVLSMCLEFKVCNSTRPQYRAPRLLSVCDLRSDFTFRFCSSSKLLQESSPVRNNYKYL